MPLPGVLVDLTGNGGKPAANGHEACIAPAGLRGFRGVGCHERQLRDPGRAGQAHTLFGYCVM
jgi:hypothetical protein